MNNHHALDQNGLARRSHILNIVKSDTNKFHMFRPKCLFDRSSNTIPSSFSMSTTCMFQEATFHI